MKFRTEVSVPESGKKVEPEDKIFTIGSCFATEMAALLQRGQLQTFANPFGTVFNPFSINQAVKKIHSASDYTEDDLITFNDRVISLDHHTSFDSRFAHLTLEKINSQIQQANTFLRETKWVIVTLGTSFIYEFLPKQKLVANCHKIPAKFFRKRLLSHLELTDSIYETVTLLKDICDDEVQILFTVSPVRHTKDGMAENMLSKAKLLTALHDILPEFPDFCTYLPVYELMMDDLRDYRFYAEDMIHPTPQAVNYIFEKFGNSYFSEAAMDFIGENFKIARALSHRPADADDESHKEFLKALHQRIGAQQQKVKHKIFPEHKNFN